MEIILIFIVVIVIVGLFSLLVWLGSNTNNDVVVNNDANKEKREIIRLLQIILTELNNPTNIILKERCSGLCTLINRMYSLGIIPTKKEVNLITRILEINKPTNSAIHYWWIPTMLIYGVSKGIITLSLNPKGIQMRKEFIESLILHYQSLH